MTINELATLAQTLSAALTTYTTKPTKAESKRIRTMLGDIKKSTASLRSTLVELDAKGY